MFRASAQCIGLTSITATSGSSSVSKSINIGSTSGLAAAPSVAPTATAPAVDDASAATAFKWETVSDGDEFNGSSLGTMWGGGYEGAGNGGNGKRDPGQITVGQGMMTMSGTADGRSAGMMASSHGHQLGRWESRMKVDGSGTGSPYHPVIALVPQGVPYNGGAGDIDFAETDVGSGQVYLFIHYPDHKQDMISTKLNLAVWHTYGIEIAPDHITWFIDGKAVSTDLNKAAVPTTPMAMNVQLDANSPTNLAPATMQVDYFRYYGLPTGGVTIPTAPRPTTGAYK